MATIGVKHPVYAPISSIPEGETPTYGAGIILGKMTKVDISFNYAEGSLYADDALAEYDAKLQGGTITIGVDELPISKRTMLFHHLTSTTAEVTTLYACADDTIPHGGFGYYKTLMVDSKRKYKARWYYNVTFHEGNEGAETANDSINFKDTEVIGTFIPVYNADVGDAIYEEVEFATEAAAVAWLDDHAGITSASTIRSVRPVGIDAGDEGDVKPDPDDNDGDSNTRSVPSTGTKTESDTTSTQATGTKTESGTSNTQATGAKTESGTSNTQSTNAKTESGTSNTQSTNAKTESGSTTGSSSSGTTSGTPNIIGGSTTK